MTRINVTLLRRHDACPAQVERFRRVFPRGGELTVKNLLKAQAAGLDTEWLIELLSESAYTAYRKARATAWQTTSYRTTAYDQACMAALVAAFEEVSA